MPSVIYTVFDFSSALCDDFFNNGLLKRPELHRFQSFTATILSRKLCFGFLRVFRASGKRLKP